MKTTSLLLAILITSFTIRASSVEISQILKTKPEYLEKIDRSPNAYTVWISCDFGSEKIKNPTSLKKLERNTVLQIELVYTTYKEAESFNQNSLNYKRLKELKKLSPHLFENNLIIWKLTGQTGCSEDNRHTFFHGFKVTIQPVISTYMMKSEIDRIGCLLKKYDTKYKDTVVIKEVKFNPPQFIAYDSSLSKYYNNNMIEPKSIKKKKKSGSVKVKVLISASGKAIRPKIIESMGNKCDEEAIRLIRRMPRWKAATIGKKTIRSYVTLVIPFNEDITEYAYKKNAEIRYKKVNTKIPITVKNGDLVTEEDCKSSVFRPVANIDSTIFKVFERNKDWNNISVTCDLTGSMSPYSAQLLFWFKLHGNNETRKFNTVTFFNDGDRKAYKDKKIGETGGIYQTSSSNFEVVQSLARKTMNNGGGGDAPENNLEALLKAIELNDSCDHYVLIADNFATPRDMKLLKKINKPIRVVVCGGSHAINVAYLNIARETGGSIHTIENDIDGLMDLKEGETLKIGTKKYKIKEGKFVSVYST